MANRTLPRPLWILVTMLAAMVAAAVFGSVLGNFMAGGIVMAVIGFGGCVVAGLSAQQMRERRWSGLGVDGTNRDPVLVALRTGVPPEDPALRAVALRLARHQRSQGVRWMGIAGAAYLMLAAMQVGLLITGTDRDALRWVLAGCFVSGGVMFIAGTWYSIRVWDRLIAASEAEGAHA